MRHAGFSLEDEANRKGIVNHSRFERAYASRRILIIMTSVLLLTVITSFVAVAGYAGFGLGEPAAIELVSQSEYALDGGSGFQPV